MSDPRSVDGPELRFVDLRRRLASLDDEIQAAVAATLSRGDLILGPAVERFEAAFARYCGVAHGVGVASGTDAITLALEALGIGPGDEVVTAASTCVPTVVAIRATGATPVLVDVHPRDWTLDPERLPEALSDRTRAIVPVHLYGRPADMPAICAFADAHDLVVVEDAAQAHGATIGQARTGSFGDAAAFSFYPTKNLGGLGDGGIVLTDRPEVAGAVRARRNYGLRDGQAISQGRCSRLDELQAAILEPMLHRLDERNGRRRELAQTYLGALDGLALQSPPPDDERRSAWHLFVIAAHRRDELLRALGQRGIETKVHYPLAIHQHPALRDVVRRGGRLERSERLAASVLSLPLYPELTDIEVERVIAALTMLAPDYASQSDSVCVR